MGLRSHGVMRIPQYLDDIANRRHRAGCFAGLHPHRAGPGAGRWRQGLRPGRRRRHGARGGAAGARETGVAFLAGRHMGHTGRIGAYAEAIAARRMVGAGGVGSGPRSGHGWRHSAGLAGRLATNPIAYALSPQRRAAGGGRFFDQRGARRRHPQPAQPRPAGARGDRCATPPGGRPAIPPPSIRRRPCALQAARRRGRLSRHRARPLRRRGWQPCSPTTRRRIRRGPAPTWRCWRSMPTTPSPSAPPPWGATSNRRRRSIPDRPVLLPGEREQQNRRRRRRRAGAGRRTDLGGDGRPRPGIASGCRNAIPD